ncbi:ABC transporter substrate-binding protein [Nocardioides marmoriginsengisoli]|uniref:ABC transporter substrate-binding protein n=1 Tax=Nocardioides marmoriginsengisoli TaxID=661483 RepID=A0A3N0CPI8_9ACTN|nr:ABC transporter substrate-binding protein [Nocardioides marmoriginsengisoli]RNL65387.1 ABC transporter substrate-binding protein [Nocardioides marmoriginsengisoli]
MKTPLHRLLALGATAVLATGTLTACGSSDESANGGTPVKGGTIVYAHEQEPPCIFGGWIQQAYISRQVLDGLVTLDDNDQVQPWLATAWKVSPDGKTYTFTLKDGVKFTDGTPLDAEAVAYNFDYWENKGGNSTAKVSIDPYFKSAKAIDATHVEITLTHPYTPFLTLITQGYFGIQSPTALKNRSAKENCEQPIGSGGFTVAEWKHGQEVILKKNPNYTSWPATAKHQGPAIVDEVQWKFVPDGVSRYASLTTGQTDVVYDVPTVNWKEAESKFDTTLYITPGKPVSAYINTVKGVFTDKLVRQAFSYGADRKSAVEAGFHGVIPYEGNGAVSQATPDYNADAAKDYAYDPDKANALLDQAGWTGRDSDGYRTKNGKQLFVKFPYPAGAVINTEGAVVLQVLQEQWKKIGFNVKLIPATQAEVFAGKYSGPDAYDASPFYWTSPSPSILWIVWRPSTEANPNGNNQSFYNNDELARVIDEANTSTDPAKASELYQQAQQIISDNAVTLPLYTQNSTYAAAKDLKDFWLEKSQGEPVFADAYFTK